mmetsp:Transcript_17705/g.43176  ORF Transcript_17705/g.43176 Transcript_17705/m.43176 type:complete len:85 (-) Transcript_17705:1307-1561(-)
MDRSTNIHPCYFLILASSSLCACWWRGDTAISVLLFSHRSQRLSPILSTEKLLVRSSWLNQSVMLLLRSASLLGISAAMKPAVA